MGKSEPSKIKEAIYKAGRFHPGKISLQYTVCNNKNCQCHDKVNPKKHGPYYQLSYSVKGKSRTRFIKSSDLEQVTKYLNEYQRIKELLSDLSEAYVEELKNNGW